MPKRETHADRIVREIVEGITSGQLAEGAALPSQRELCERYGGVAVDGAAGAARAGPC
ncbi:GntR family transcriptional regulator [Dactylosporangium roseum]|uniref:GntR family transcriptional regulator n=1 Tax=Dactylosporangium roseum TaxID=47989 RepID=A0ABY5ZGB8_9ACTN|nr:GntR family transcriptional regulator [Dactylosporangium roseum]UWZ39792.1 GntR family transcriptional regulator [Dactylosporangium roseum]